MNSIKKHSFEAVSLLTADNGVLDVTIIPAVNQLDWVIPSNLILSVDDYDERIWTYLWNNQEVSVYHLVPRDETPDKLIILEGNTDVHRIAIQTKGELRTKQVRISDVKDTDLPEELKEEDDNASDIEHQEVNEVVDSTQDITDVENEVVDSAQDLTDTENEVVDESSNELDDGSGLEEQPENDDNADENHSDEAVEKTDEEVSDIENTEVEQQATEPSSNALIDDNFLIDDDALIDDNFVLLDMEETKADNIEQDEIESFVIDDFEEDVVEIDEPEVSAEEIALVNKKLEAEIRKAHDIKLPYIFQSVIIDNELFLVPDLDTISHRLVDLDG